MDYAWHFGRLALAAAMLAGGCFAPDADPIEDSESSTSEGTSSGSATTVTTSSTSAATTGTTTATTSTTTDDPSASSTTDPSTSTTAGGSTGEPVPACERNLVCAEPAPKGWMGPAARLAAAGDAAPPTCGGPLSQEVLQGYLNLAADPAECGCSCDPVNADCTRTGAADYSDTGCVNALGGGNMLTTCSSLGGGAPAFIISEPPVNTGTCTPNVSENLPVPALTNARTLCTPAMPPPMCTGEPGVCLPETMEGAYCISRMGDEQCPADTAYVQRELVFTAVDDTRGCSQCSCGTITGTCTGVASLFNTVDCQGSPTDFPADGSCVAQTSFDNGFLTVTAVNASCPSSGGNPLGDVDPDGVVTICCATF